MGKKDGKRKGEEAADEEVKVKKQKTEVSCWQVASRAAHLRRPWAGGRWTTPR